MYELLLQLDDADESIIQDLLISINKEVLINESC